MNDKSKNIIIIILSIITLLCSFGFGYIFYQNIHKEPQEPICITLRDTFIIKDTLIVEKVRYKSKYDTIFSRDIIINDTVYKMKDTLSLDIDHKEALFDIHNDTIDINGTILYHGFLSNIDEINVGYDLHYDYVPAPVKKNRRFHISLQGGFYAGYNLVDRRVFVGPGGGIGFSYDIW